MFKEARNYFCDKLCCNKHISNRTCLNELSENISYYLGNTPIKTTLQGSIYK